MNKEIVTEPKDCLFRNINDYGIPKDLILFIDVYKPEVLTGIRLEYEGFNIFRLRHVQSDRLEYRTNQEAIALLTYWMLNEMAGYRVGITYNKEQGAWIASYQNVAGSWIMYSDRNKLPALWQAYKAVKKIKDE